MEDDNRVRITIRLRKKTDGEEWTLEGERKEAGAPVEKMGRQTWRKYNCKPPTKRKSTVSVEEPPTKKRRKEEEENTTITGEKEEQKKKPAEEDPSLKDKNTCICGTTECMWTTHWVKEKPKTEDNQHLTCKCGKKKCTKKEHDNVIIVTPDETTGTAPATSQAENEMSPPKTDITQGGDILPTITKGPETTPRAPRGRNPRRTPPWLKNKPKTSNHNPTPWRL